jgi:hypothetical protein
MSSADAVVRPRHAAFVFDRVALVERRISLHYLLAGGPDPDVALTEILELPASLPLPAAGDPVVQDLLQGLHRVMGVSYYKAAVPSRIVAEPTSPQDAELWDMLYGVGMGEFYYRNRLQPLAAQAFPRTDQRSPVHAPAQPDVERALVLVGGGKDSIIAREVVRHAGVACDGFAVGQAPWITRSAAAMQLPLLTVRRTLAPELAALNRRGAYNGHVPISACIAFVAQLVAYLGGYSSVIVANERSADEGNTTWGGLKVNHQWSKSLDFERAFQAWCARRLPRWPRYFSILRPLSEVRIAKELVSYPQYLQSFASCNANFRQNQNSEPERWCGRCPKCVFVQLIMAPFLDDKDLDLTFGRRFIDDEANRGLLAELTGDSGIKPFECVGTPEESLAALAVLYKQGRLHGSLNSWYAERWGQQTEAFARSWLDLLEPSNVSSMPEEWNARLHAYLGRHRS